MKVIAAIAVAVSLSGASPAWAGKTAPITEGTLRTRDGAEVVAVPLEHTEVKVRVDGFIADVEVDQRFSNPYKHKIEATYLFPLPAQSAVDGYELVTGGRTIKGEIKLKDDAKAVYTAARTRGYVAALLTQERPNLFTQAVANIEPGATVDVKLHYVQALGYDDGAYELVFPMVAGPRFVPKTSKADPAAVQAPGMPAGMRSGHDIGLSVEIDAGVPINNVVSPSHQVELAKPSAHETRVKIGAHDTIPNKDFVLRYAVAGDKPQFAIVPHRAGGAGSFFFMAQPPVHPDAAQVTPKEMVFVIDTSSSMQGRPLAKAKEAIGKALQTMHPDDTFQIVRFDDTASALGERPIANKPKNVQIALDWLAKLDAGGGTDMTTGIKAALAFPHDKARLRVVVFLTDGFIGNEDEILALVQDKLGDSRLFSFGVGSSVNRYLLEEMAAIGRGTVQVVRPDEDTQTAVTRLANRVASPLLTDISIDWKGLAVDGVTPARIPDLFAGQPLVLAGRYTKAGAATVTVHGKLAGRPVTFDVPVSLPETRDRPAIAAIWARGKITELMRRQLKAEQPAVKQQIIELALANHLMSAYTSFVAVDTSHVTAGGKPQTVAVPVEVPDGLRSTQADYGGSGSGIIYGGVIAGEAAGYGAPMASPSKPVAAPAMHVAMQRKAMADDDGDDAPKKRLEAKRESGEVSIQPEPPVEQKPMLHADKSSSMMLHGPADTSVVAMRKDIDRCWASGAINVQLEFDAAGTASKVVVTGGDSACVQAAAKKWRRVASHSLNLGFSKE
jgi:Ca-activated chloride channel family protein